MGNKLYVGNLPYSVRDGDLEQSFGQFGTVTRCGRDAERPSLKRNYSNCVRGVFCNCERLYWA